MLFFYWKKRLFLKKKQGLIILYLQQRIKTKLIFMFSVSMFSANSLVFEYVPTLSTVEIEARIIKHQILMFSVSMFSSMEKYQEYSYFSMH